MRGDVVTRRSFSWAPPVSLLPRVVREPHNLGSAILAGWLLAIIPSLALGAAVNALLPQTAQPHLPMGTTMAVIAVAVVAPVLETLIMAVALTVLRLFLSPTLAVLVSAIGWGIAHSLAAPAWGLVIWWPFLVFSTLYVAWRQRSLLAALGVPAAVHCLQNLFPALALYANAAG